VKPSSADWSCNRDFVDYGIGAGFYWISSKAFPSFDGSFVEPIRLDFHHPTGENKGHWWRVLVFRAGLLVFPAGFEPDAFLARPGVAHRISRDWVPYYGVFADVGSLFNN
jgi:hypothetical protein